MPTMRRWALLALCGAAASGQLRTVAAWPSMDDSKYCDDMTFSDMVDEGISYYPINDSLGTGCNSITADGVHPFGSVPCDANPGDYAPTLFSDEWFPSVCDVCTASCEAAVPGICANAYGQHGAYGEYASCSATKKSKNKGKKLSKKEVKKLCKKKKSKKACKKTKSGGKKVCKVKKGKCVPK
jgi:hypothetical protein